MRIALLGVRGSTPAPGAGFVRYGGHTSCVAVLPDDSDVPRLVLDAGTGLRGLAALLAGRAYDGSIVLTHLHWDHMQGLPFCPPLDQPESRVDLYLPSSEPLAALTRIMSPPYFPITPAGLHGRWRFLPSACGPMEGYEVRVAEIVHKGGTACGIRVEHDGRSVAYLPDHSPQLGSLAAEDLAAGVDVLLHDGQFQLAEQALADSYGHATIPDALAFAARCGAARLVLTHHAPTRTDDELDILAKEYREAEFAREGDVLTI